MASIQSGAGRRRKNGGRLVAALVLAVILSRDVRVVPLLQLYSIT